MPFHADRSLAGEASYDGATADALAAHAGVPRAVVYGETTSTLDIAHALAGDGAIAGTLVVADAQTQGRGRGGRSWSSHAGAGVWLTLIERPDNPAALDVLSLRVGLEIANALDPFAEETIGLKWPNDLYCLGHKLGGILVEARWREARLEWIAIGVGINVQTPPDQAMATGLRAGASRLDVLGMIVPAIRRAAMRRGCLDAAEERDFAWRDIARGKSCVSPAVGVVRGIDACGALLVDVGSEIIAARSGSLVFKEESEEAP